MYISERSETRDIMTYIIPAQKHSWMSMSVGTLSFSLHAVGCKRICELERESRLSKRCHAVVITYVSCAVRGSAPYPKGALLTEGRAVDRKYLNRMDGALLQVNIAYDANSSIWEDTIVAYIYILCEHDSTPNCHSIKLMEFGIIQPF